MAQELRAVIALSDNLDLIPRWLTTLTPVSRSDALFWPFGYQACI